MYGAIVIGARCAGAVTAMPLARSGHRVLLVERGVIPRDVHQGRSLHTPARPTVDALYVAWVATSKAHRQLGLAELVIRASLQDAREANWPRTASPARYQRRFPRVQNNGIPIRCEIALLRAQTLSAVEGAEESRGQLMSVLTLRSISIGILATLTMDILTGVAYKLRLIAPLPPHLIGRWFGSVARGQLFHSDIGQVSAINHEMAIAVPVHYAIGVTLALVYLRLSSAPGLTARNPVTAVAFALCTSLLPWLLMFPAMGYGWFGVHGPKGNRLFLSSLVTHCFYGVGLWLATSSMS